jgi:hypothetical protein
MEASMNAEEPTPEPPEQASHVPSDDELMQQVAEIMTSGIAQKGAKYTLPESMLVALLKRTYTDGFEVGVNVGSKASFELGLSAIEDNLRKAYMAGFRDGKGTGQSQ